MSYAGPRRKSRTQKLCEQLDPGCRLESLGRIGYSPQYVVRDSDGVEIGYTDGNEGAPSFAWLRAAGVLRGRELREWGAVRSAAIQGETYAA